MSVLIRFWVNDTPVGARRYGEACVKELRYASEEEMSCHLLAETRPLDCVRVTLETYDKELQSYDCRNLWVKRGFEYRF